MGRDTPRYFIEPRPGKFYWQPSSELRGLGWPSERLSDERSVAVARAISINQEVDQWVAAGKPARDSSQASSPAADARRPSARGSVNALLDLFQFTDAKYPKHPGTKKQYDAECKYLRKWIGPFPVKSITPRMCESRYNKLAERIPGRAASIMRIGRRAFGRARFLSDPGSPLYIGKADNPFSELNLKGGASEGRLWTRPELEAMGKAAAESNQDNYPSIGVAIELNWWLGQREGDILALPRDALAGETLVIRQNKTTRRVHLPVALLPRIHALAARALEIQKKRNVESLTHLLVNEDNGKPWDEHAFRKAFRKVRDNAKLPKALQFMHLRHTAVVEMEDAGCTIPEIASVSGHSLTGVTSILERYGRRTRKQAENAINKRLAQEEKDGG